MDVKGNVNKDVKEDVKGEVTNYVWLVYHCQCLNIF